MHHDTSVYHLIMCRLRLNYISERLYRALLHCLIHRPHTLVQHIVRQCGRRHTVQTVHYKEYRQKQNSGTWYLYSYLHFLFLRVKTNLTNMKLTGTATA